MNKIKILNSNWLKIIAIIAMTIDHIAWLIFPGLSHDPIAIILHIIGRLTFPIMAFFVTEGWHYTRNRKKYAIRLLIFAGISHIPYMLQSMAFKEYGWLSLIPFATGNNIGRFLNQTSVLWSYFIGVMMLIVNESNLKQWLKTILIVLLGVTSSCADWSCIGSFVIFFVAANRGKKKTQLLYFIIFAFLYAVVYFFAIDRIYGLIQLCVIIAIPVLLLYNGKRGENPMVNKVMKWVFYIYYPLHLLIIGIIGLLY